MALTLPKGTLCLCCSLLFLYMSQGQRTMIMNNPSRFYHQESKTFCKWGNKIISPVSRLCLCKSLPCMLVCSKVKTLMLLEAITGIWADEQGGSGAVISMGRQAGMLCLWNCSTLTRSCYKHAMIYFVYTHT